VRKIASNKDYTLSWWDYGYPIWYYSETNTLIDGGKHQNDNYIISKIMLSDSPELMANFSRLAVERYVGAINSYKEYEAHDRDEKYIPKEYQLYSKGELYHAVGRGNGAVVESIFEGGAKELRDPQEILNKLSSKEYTPPAKSRNVYIYFPYKMVNIFSTVMLFGNLDLTTGKALREAVYYAGYLRSKKDGKFYLSNGLVFDSKKGLIYFGKAAMRVKNFITTKNLSDGTIELKPQILHNDGSLAIVYLQSFNKVIVMDLETFASNFVQMGLLGNYDKDLFELVVASPFSRIYKVKR